MTQVGLAIFVYAKNFKILGEIGWLARVVYFNDPVTGYECQRSGPSRVDANEWRALTCTAVAMAVCVCVCSRMRVRAYFGMRACVMCLLYTIIKFDPG